MGKYRTVHAIYVSNPHVPDKPERDIIKFAGEVIELEDEVAKGHLEAGAVVPHDESAAEAAAEQKRAEAEALAELIEQRPGNNASKEEWRAYAQQVGVGDIPDDAKREDMMAAVDAKLASIQ